MTRPETDLARRLRRDMTGTEWRVWNRLKGERLDGWKFRRQHPIGPYVADFCCVAARLVVEIDGPDHGNDPAEAYDLRRAAWLESEGYRVLRFPVTFVDDDLDSVIDSIYQGLAENSPPHPAPPDVKNHFPTQWGRWRAAPDGDVKVGIASPRSGEGGPQGRMGT